MLALRVDFLRGRSVSTDVAHRDRAEWPPHPARLFYALAAAWHEGEPEPDLLKALHWLEGLPPPAIHATEASERSIVTAFVPVNDAKLSSDAAKPISLLPGSRSRQARTFPSVTPVDASVVYIWPEAAPTEFLHRALLDLSSRVSRLGHSSSFVALRLIDDAPAPTWLPDDSGPFTFRVPGPGLLEALDEAHARRVVTGIRGQLPCGWCAYRSAADVPAPPPQHPTVFSDMIVFRKDGAPLPCSLATAVTAALRGSAMVLADQPPPEAISGHTPDGKISRRSHVAWIALPDVAHPYADGHLLGVAAVLPRTLSQDERVAVLKTLGRLEGATLTMGPAGVWRISRMTSPRPYGLLPRPWVRPSDRWATATPIVLDRFPKKVLSRETEDMVADACERIGLPRPRHVVLNRISSLAGAPPAFAYVEPSNGKPPRPMVHALLIFDEPVSGPMLLGAGRYRGLGLCRPLEEEEE